MTEGTDGEGQDLVTDHHHMHLDNMEVGAVMEVHLISVKTMITIKGEMMTRGGEAMVIVIEVLKVREAMIDLMLVVIRNLEAVSAISAAKRVILRGNVQKVVEMMTGEEAVVTSEDKMTIAGEMMTAEVDMTDVHSAISEVLCMTLINLRQLDLN